MENRVIVFDTTLRDGEQSPGCSMTPEEKLEIALRLAALNVDVIEAGFAAASPGDGEAIRLIASRARGPVICSLARCCQKDIDQAAEALEPASPAKRRIHVFIATSPIHMRDRLHKTEAEVIALIQTWVAYAKTKCMDVEFSAEDATRSDPGFLANAVQTAIEAGATTINIPDTVGIMEPDEFGDLISQLLGRVPALGQEVVLSVHCHNDLGLATANTVAALKVGARQAECTINGIGERAGNAALEEVAVIINKKASRYSLTTDINTPELNTASQLVAQITGSAVQANKAIVGANAFAHEAGIHQHGMLQNPETYEIISPDLVGGTRGLVMGKHSGLHALGAFLKDRGFHLTPEETRLALERLKDLADHKKVVTEADVLAIVGDVSTQSEVAEVYRLLHLGVMSDPTMAAAVVRIAGPNGAILEASSYGNGELDAVCKAIDNAIGQPNILAYYEANSVTRGSDAQAEVTVSLNGDERCWIGRAVHYQNSQACALAYLRAINSRLAT